MSWIGVLDCNNFFVSCERLFRPDLIGKPVVVLSSNDGCVVARSQEVKDMGVPMGVPYFQVKDTLKRAGTTTFSSHFALYRDISRRVFSVMRQELATVEQYSIDEAFFLLESGTDPQAIALHLKRTVERCVGIPVSVGVAKTKTQAKYANDQAKRGAGVVVYAPEEWRHHEEKIQLKDIWGVGGKIELRQKAHNLYTVRDFLTADPARISKLFGVAGERLRSELAGIPLVTAGNRLQPQKTVMSSRSFRNETTDSDVVADALAYHVRHAVKALRAMNMTARSIQVTIQPSRHGDFMLRGGSATAVLSAYSADTFEFLRVARELLHELYESGVPYKKAGVLLSDFCPEELVQESLFPTKTKSSSSELLQVVDTLNKRNGNEVVLLGSRLKTQAWQSRVDQRSPAYTTRWNDIPTVVS